MSDNSPHTPPQKSEPLPSDTVPFSRHTSQTAYRTSDLNLGRFAVLADLRRYVQVPYDQLLKCVGVAPFQQVLSQTRDKLVEDEILNHETSYRWSQFTSPPARSGMHEEATFEPLGRIISTILASVPGSTVSYLVNPKQAPLSERQNNSRPDGYVVLGSGGPGRRIHWFDIAVPFEFKKTRDPKALRDNEQKIIWSLHNIMREDPCRRFAFGITIEDTQLRLWLSNRAFLAVSEAINFLEDVDRVISLFHSLGSATNEALGWDPTIERQPDGNYRIAVGNQTFITTREIATYGADSMVGRGTRVYEAKDNQGERVAIKDSWREADRKSEGDIFQEILASCKEKLSAEEAADVEKHFIRVRVYEDVKISGTQDVTLNPMAGNNDNSAFTWVHIDLEPVCSEARHLSSKGNIPDSSQILLPTKLGVVRRDKDTIPCRVHVRIVFHDVGVALKDVTLLADNLRCLCHALKGLYYLHKAGWVHRDFSVGNAIWIADDSGGTGIGKLGDFEYAKRVDSDISHDVRTGTMHFMAVEVEYQGYLFQPSIASRSIYHDPLGIISPDGSSTIRTRPSFRMNFLHDIESVWWAFTWVLFYHTETTSTHHPFDTQWNEFQKAFPGAIDYTSRHHFFVNSARLEEALGTLSDACQPFCSNILFFAEALKQSYRKAEKPYPELALDDVLAYETHDMAFNYIQDAQSKAGSIVLQPLPEALNNKRQRTGPEGEISQRASKRRR